MTMIATDRYTPASPPDDGLRDPLMSPTPNETKPRQFRLGDDTLEAIDRLAAHYGLSSRAEVIRYLVRAADSQLPKPKRTGKPKT